MLSFTALSEAPLNQVNLVGDVLVNIDDVLANITQGTLTVEGTANTTITSISSSFTIESIDFSAEANITTGTVSALLSQNNVNISSNNTLLADSLTASIIANLPDQPTGVIFDFSVYANDYDRSRVIYLLAEDENTTIHIAAENRTVSVDNMVENNVVHIAPENRTIFIDKAPNNSTVYILE